MANEKNLIPFNKRTESEQRETARKGGQKSGEVRRKRKAMKEQMEMLLALPIKNEEQKAFMEQLGINEDNMDNQMMLIMAIYSKAMKGDLEAFKVIREMINTGTKSESSNLSRVVIVDNLEDVDDESND